MICRGITFHDPERPLAGVGASQLSPMAYPRCPFCMLRPRFPLGREDIGLCSIWGERGNKSFRKD